MTFRSLATLLGGTPADTSDTPAEPVGTRFVGFGEGVTSAIANRPHYALAENTDDLNSRMAIFEVGGLDTAYDLGLAAVPGGGRTVITDSGAIEAVPPAGAEYSQDAANAQFRVDQEAATNEGMGGYDYKGSRDPEELINGAGWAGYLDRRKLGINPAGYGSFFTDNETATLNPGGLTDEIRLDTGGRFFYTIAAGPTPAAGNYTDLLLGIDLIEISGSLVDDGLYIVDSLGSLNTNVAVTTLAGATPSFTLNDAAQVTLYRIRAGTIGSSYGGSPRSALQANVLGSGKGGATALDLVTGSEASFGGALRARFPNPQGVMQTGMTLDRFGRMYFELRSDALGESHGTPGQSYSRLFGGAYAGKISRSGGTTTHELGIHGYANDDQVVGRYDFMSLSPLNIAGGTGLDLSIPFDFMAQSPVDGEINFTAGAALSVDWVNLIPNYGAIVEVLTGPVATPGLYLAMFPSNTGNGAIFLRNLDNTIPTHLPTSGAATLVFHAAQRMGRMPSTGGTANSLEPFPSANLTMTPYNVMMGGQEQDSCALALFSPGNVIGGDDRALLRAFNNDQTIGVAPLEIFSIEPGDGPGGPDFGRVKGANFITHSGDFRCGIGDFVYSDIAGDATTRTKFYQIPLSIGQPHDLFASPWVFNGNFWQAAAYNTRITFDITPFIPEGGVFVAAEVLITPGVSRATSGDRVQVLTPQHTSDYAGSPSSSAYSIGTATPDDGTINTQVVRRVVPGPFNTPDNPLKRQMIMVESGATGVVDDEIRALRVEILDPGPRNF